jgi:alpha-tubulin suppressor-like RCC1 family protein
MLRGLPPGRPVLRLACGSAHCLALVHSEQHAFARPAGDVYSWGRGAEGQLGHSIDDEFEDDLRAKLCGSARGLESPRLIDSLSDEPCVDVLCTWGESSAVLLATGAVLTWGQNDELQLGHSGPASERELKTVWEPAHVELPEEDTVVIALACGRAHMAALTSSGAVLCWGLAEAGQLGRHKHRVRPWPVGMADTVDEGYLPPGVPIRALMCGATLTAAMLESGAVFAWGSHERFRSDFPTCVREADADGSAAPHGELLACAAAGETLLLVNR